jgi:hypothetical protein
MSLEEIHGIDPSFFVWCDVTHASAPSVFPLSRIVSDFVLRQDCTPEVPGANVVCVPERK